MLRHALRASRLGARAAGIAAATTASSSLGFCESTDDDLELVEIAQERWEWRPRTTPKATTSIIVTTASAASGNEPVVTTPVKVLDTPGITIREFFGLVSSKETSTSFAMATVHRPDESGFQAPAFAEYIIVNSGSLDLHTVHADGAHLEKTHVSAGQGAYLPAGLRVKWSWPEPCTYTVVCIPAFSPQMAGSEPAPSGVDTVVDATSRAKLADMHRAAHETTAASQLTPARELPLGISPLLVKPVAVVEAPGITILEHFGNVSSSDATASLGRAVVKGASQEAWQAPGFDEYVICNKGAIEFLYGEGKSKSIVAGEGIFLPKHLRVKWIWPEATEYTVLCLPAFTPALCGREAEENATNAKDSASMARLQQLHAQKA